MRLQLALNVDDLDRAIDFYSAMFDTAPAKVRPGYANFAIADPPLKLVLFEGAGESGSINHLGVEVETTGEVVEAEARLSASGLATSGVDDTVCCYAEKAETWLHAPDGNSWEWYVKKADIEQFEAPSVDGGAMCCASAPVTAATTAAQTIAAEATAEAGACSPGAGCC